MKFLLCFLLISLTSAQERFKNKTLDHFFGKGESGGDRFFYLPTEPTEETPKNWGYNYEDVYFKSSDDTKLHGWFLKPKGQEPKGAMVFHHGNSGAVGYHLGLITWAVNSGYQVLLYDYRGFGKSEGKVDREGIISDAHAAILYLQNRPDVQAKQVFSFGHSLGGAKSLAAIGRNEVPNLAGVVCFAGFSSYQKMARKFAGEFGANLIKDDFSPRDLIEKISPVPLLIIHGENDKVVPVEQGKELFEKAKEPKKIFLVKDAGHNDALHVRDRETIKKTLHWMKTVLESQK